MGKFNLKYIDRSFKLRPSRELLSLDPGTLGASPFRVDVNSPSGIRMPNGNEFGANPQWLPGGKTGGGILEATVDQIQPGTYIFNSVF